MTVVHTEQSAVAADEHVVTFYERDDALCRTVGAYLGQAIEAGGAGIAIATPEHRRGIEAQLRATEIDVAAAVAGGALVFRDAADTMATFMPAGGIDGKAFGRVIGALLREASDVGGPIRTYGEMVALLWDAGDVLGAIELEELWNALAADHNFSLLCGYRSPSVARPEQREARRQVCRLHSAVVPCVDDDAPEVSGEFAPDSGAPAAARRLVTDALLGWGLGGRMLDDAHVVVSELATNAMLHARSPFSVAVRRTESGVRLSVRDASTAQPVGRDEPADLGGRGLRLVSALASRWGVEPGPHGKTVWAELRPQAPR